MDQSVQIKDAIKVRSAMENYQDTVYLNLIRQLNTNCQEVFKEDLGSEFVRNCGRDLAGEVVRNCFDTSNFYITVDQLAKRILEFSYENEYDPLSQNGGVGEVSKAVYNYNELHSEELTHISKVMDNAQDKLFEKSRKEDQKLEQAGMNRYKESVVENVQDNAGETSGTLRDSFTGEAQETTYDTKNKRWRSGRLQVDHVQARATATYNSVYIKETGVDALQSFYNSNDNFQLMLDVANNAKSDVRVCEVTENGKTSIQYLTSNKIKAMEHTAKTAGKDIQINDISYKATPEQLTEAVVAKLEEVNLEKENQSQKKIQALKDKGYLDENGKVPKAVKKKLLQNIRHSQNVESKVILQNTKYSKVAADALTATKSSIGKIIAGQVIYYAAPPLVYELRVILNDKNITLDNALERLGTSAKRIGEYVLSKLKNIFVNITLNSLKKFIKSFMDILINLVKASVKKLMKMAKNLVLSTVDAVLIIADKNADPSQKANAVVNLFSVTITSCIVELLFELAADALHIPEPFDDIVFGPLQILTTVICTNLTLLILKKVDLFDVDYGFKMSQIRKLFKETREAYISEFEIASSYADSEVEWIIERAKQESMEIYENLQEIDLKQQSVRGELEKINHTFSMDIDFEKDWLKFLGIA